MPIARKKSASPAVVASRKRALSSSSPASPRKKAGSPLAPSRVKKATQPETTAQYELASRKGFDSLVLKKKVAIPALGEYDCLVEIKAVSLNYRDLGVADGTFPFAVKLPRVPGSDGAGVVLAIGGKVTEFRVGDKVCTLLNQAHQYGPLTPKIMESGLGALLDGTLRQYGNFPETGLVAMPKNLDYDDAATLPCAALTAWNALYGLESKSLKPGQYVLTQGTGGVSCAAIQFALAAGANVVTTTSSDSKRNKLKQHFSRELNDQPKIIDQLQVINYKKTPKWGEAAKKLTPYGEGFDHIIEIGGPTTMEQSMKAVKMEGVISVIGFVGGIEAAKQPSTFDALIHMCTVRGLYVGSRAQFQAMVKAIEATNILPVVDRSFRFEDARNAYEHMHNKKHFGKVVIQVAGEIPEKRKNVSAEDY